ncbi:MAG: hypothetical protein LBD22_03420 [Spirochaetaceae bacterium]|jgi:hypothetical protein|nr:hypothetical protein [Spirochaetaceae bacterium]
MDEQVVLHHLIEVEKNAAQIVERAQQEAAAHIAENDRVCRNEFDSAYTKEYTALEEDYKRRLAEIESAYQIELDAQRVKLEHAPPNLARFAAIAQDYFAQAGG